MLVHQANRRAPVVIPYLACGTRLKSESLQSGWMIAAGPGVVPGDLDTGNKMTARLLRNLFQYNVD